MKLKYIQQEDIQQVMGISQSFQTVEEFCAFLEQNASGTENTGIRQSIRPLIKKIDPQAKPNKNTFEENVDWIRKYCTFQDGAEALDEVKQAQPVDQEPEQASFAQIKEAYETEWYQHMIQLDGDDLDYPEDISLCEGGLITQQKEFTLTVTKEGLSLDTKKVLIVEAEGSRVLALGYLQEKESNVYDAVFDCKEHILYERFAGQSQYRLVVFSTDGRGYSRVLELDYRSFDVEKERPLCIDFGTSNTTAGSYGILNPQADEPEIVRFIDRSVAPANSRAMLPTIIYVEDCADPENIQYLFGYEARRRIEQEHYESKASVYYEIKRWMTCAEEEEEIRDSKNHKARPRRKEMIQAYLDYVIASAEQYFETQFEKIHFSAPVKFKEQFLHVLQELYKGKRDILSGEESIDEGIAIVYNQIITLLYDDLKTNANMQGQEKSIMIMDCGGGTTDLASCDYSYQKTSAGVELLLKTGFENGNANFGGNNITYRILQLLKIKIAAKYLPGVIDQDARMLDLIHQSENSILGIIESQSRLDKYNSDNANDKIYAKFLENYERAEAVIPTRFTNNGLYRGTEELKRIKRNFYYLWRKAEQIKIDFFKTERVVIEFQEDKEDMEIILTDTNNYYLYCAQEKGGKLSRFEEPFLDISITIKEINRVICADVYALLCGLFQDGSTTAAGKSVDMFDYYKLSGQSCKITLFSELLKEYIPGRKLRPAIIRKEDEQKKHSEDLKLDCVLGCIHYVKDQIRPEMKVFMQARLPEIIYDLWFKGGHTPDRKLFNSKQPNSMYIDICHENTKEYPLKITGQDGIVERELILKLLKPNSYDQCWTTDKIEGLLRKKSIVDEAGIQDFIQRLRAAAEGQTEPVNLIFAAPAKGGYGVYLGQIYAKSEQDQTVYHWMQFLYQNFEDASKTFFDGRR